MTLPEETNLGSPEDVSLYVWSLCANSNYLFLGTNVGVFRVALADFHLGVSPSAAQPTDQSALAYPNPASSNFTVRFYLARPGSANITLYDVLGNIVYEAPASQCGAGWNSIPIRSSLMPGCYTFQVTAGGTVSRGRVAVVSE